MNSRTPLRTRADRGAWIARAAVVLGLAGSIGLLLYVGDGIALPALAGIERGVGAMCAGLGNAGFPGADSGPVSGAISGAL